MPLVRSDLEALSLTFSLSPVQVSLKDHRLLGIEGIPGHNDLQCLTVNFTKAFRPQGHFSLCISDFPGLLGQFRILKSSALGQQDTSILGFQIYFQKVDVDLARAVTMDFLPAYKLASTVSASRSMSLLYICFSKTKKAAGSTPWLLNSDLTSARSHRTSHRRLSCRQPRHTLVQHRMEGLPVGALSVVVWQGQQQGGCQARLVAETFLLSAMLVTLLLEMWVAVAVETLAGRNSSTVILPPAGASSSLVCVVSCAFPARWAWKRTLWAPAGRLGTVSQSMQAGHQQQHGARPALLQGKPSHWHEPLPTAPQSANLQQNAGYCLWFQFLSLCIFIG